MVNLKLLNYIKEGMEKGYTKQELDEILKKSGWSKSEVSEALGSLNKPEKVSSPLRKKPSPDSVLVDFINQSFKQGIREDQIKQALMAKHWPMDKINEALAKSTKPEPIKKPIKEKPKAKKKEYVGKGFSGKRLFLYILWFIIIGFILTATIGVFYYVNAMSNFSVINSNTGEEVKGYCLEEDCSDMKEFVNNEVMGQWIIILTIALSVSLIVVILHYFIPNKETLIWIMNILLFLFIVYILYTWFSTYNGFAH